MVTINLFSSQGWGTAGDAWTNGPADVANNAQTVYFDETAQGSLTTLESGDVVYTDSGLTTQLTHSGTSPFYYYEIGVDAFVVQIDGTGNVVTSPVTTTTTTTAAPQYTITVTPGLTVNEGDTFNVIFQYAGGGTTGLTVTGTAVEADFSTWPAEIGAGNTTATLDFTGTNTVDLEFKAEEDLSDNTNSGGSPEGPETIIFTLTDGTTETITITDSSQNQPPVTSDVSDTIAQTGSASNFITIDLSGGTADPEGNPNNNLGWVLTGIPTNGTFRDPSLPNTDLTAGDLDYTLSGYEVQYYPGTTFQGTETITGWKVLDPNGGPSNTSNIIISVTAPTNQPPTATDVSTTISGTGAGVNFNFSRAATDDLIGGALQPFQWCLADGTPQTLTDINNALTYGVISNITAEAWQYTTNASAAFKPWSTCS